MPSELRPVVRYLIICEDVVAETANLRRVTLVGLIGSLRSLEQPPFPILHRELCIHLQMTGCRGAANGRIEIQHADSGKVVFRTQTHVMGLTSDPLEIVGVTFRISNCLFPTAGLYWVQFWYNEHMLEQRPIVWR